MSNIMKYRIAGSKDFAIPVVSKVHNPDEESAASANTPEWMVKIDELTTSLTLGFPDYCELLGWFGEAGRKINNSTTQYPSSSLKHSEVVIVVPVAGYLASLESKMNKGETLKVVKIINFADNKELQAIEYKGCLIRSIQQELERAVIKMSIMKKINTIKVYNEGVCTGQMVSSVDYGTGAVEFI